MPLRPCVRHACGPGQLPEACMRKNGWGIKESLVQSDIFEIRKPTQKNTSEQRQVSELITPLADHCVGGVCLCQNKAPAKLRPPFLTQVLFQLSKRKKRSHLRIRNEIYFMDKTPVLLSFRLVAVALSR